MDFVFNLFAYKLSKPNVGWFFLSEKYRYRISSSFLWMWSDLVTSRWTFCFSIWTLCHSCSFFQWIISGPKVCIFFCQKVQMHFGIWICWPFPLYRRFRWILYGAPSGTFVNRPLCTYKLFDQVWKNEKRKSHIETFRKDVPYRQINSCFHHVARCKRKPSLKLFSKKKIMVHSKTIFKSRFSHSGNKFRMLRLRLFIENACDCDWPSHRHNDRILRRAKITCAETSLPLLGDGTWNTYISNVDLCPGTSSNVYLYNNIRATIQAQRNKKEIK